MKMAYEKRKSMYGYCFIALWFIGALIFFLIPVVESLFYSFREVSPTPAAWSVRLWDWTTITMRST